MDFEFTEEQQHLREAVARWVERGYDFERRRAIVRAGGFDKGIYAQLAELGLAGLYVPDDAGGMGMGPVEGMIVMEELGRGIVMEPVPQALVAGATLNAYAPQGVKAAWLPKIAAGESIVVLAYHERKARWNLASCAATGIQADGGWKVTGEKSVVPVADHADAFLVPAIAGGKMALFLIEKGAAGVSTRGYVTQDGSRAGELELQDAPATLVTLDGLAALEYAVDVGIAAACAEGVGVMDKTMALTVEYLNTRKQFGVALSTFQALRHRVADMKMQLELARSMSYYATLKLNAPAEERRRALARAKYQLGVSMRFIGQQSVQMHGGIGVTDEYAGSHYFKKLTQLELSWGVTIHHLGEVSARMQETAGVFS
jgi:alkylation response protein AidB-like acyl-CoA dehydrogenase